MTPDEAARIYASRYGFLDPKNPPAWLREDWKQRRVNLMLDREPGGAVPVFKPSDAPYIGMMLSVAGGLVTCFIWWLL